MSGTYGSNFIPLEVGSSDSGDFSSWLGAPVPRGNETYVVVQADVAIAASSNGKQLTTALSSGQASWAVTLATGLASANYRTCGAIPSSHTAAIASGAYFLALRDSPQHVLQVRGATTGAIVIGEPLMVGTGADLINVFTGSWASALTGQASTSSGLGVVFQSLDSKAAVALESLTGVATVSGSVRYRAPFRGAT